MITARDRVIGFFLRSPDEELTRADMVLRWGDTGDSIWEALRRLEGDGLIKARSVNGRHHYQPTPALLSLGDAKR